MKKWLKIILPVCALSVTILAFQNCAQDFNPQTYNASSTGSPANQAPRIVTAPISKNVTLLDPVDLKVEVSGQNLVFVWSKNGVVIPAATTDTLSLAKTRSTDAGEYKVDISNSYGSVSTTITVSVTQLATQTKPMITTAPVLINGTIFNGTSFFVNSVEPFDQAIFTVAISSPIPVTYQWYKVIKNMNGTDASVTAINGATAATLSFQVTTAADAATYRVIVTSDYGVEKAEADLLLTPFDFGGIGGF